MDELEWAKIGGVACAALLAFVGLSQVSKAVIGTHELDEPAYSVEIAEDGGGGEVVEATPLHELVAAADAAEGATTFKKKCASCHSAEPGGKNGTGPALYGIMGRAIASVDGFGYSSALDEKGGDWDWDSMNAFLTKPKDWAPGTKMSFAGFRKETDRANVMAWLNEQSDAPIAAPAAE